MEYKVSVCNNLCDLENIWRRFACSKRAYLSYDFQLGISKVFYHRRMNLFGDYGSKRLIYLTAEANKCEAIFPMLVDIKAKRIKTIGNVFSVGYNDIITDQNCNIDIIDAMMTFLHNAYRGYQIEMLDILENSPIVAYFSHKKNGNVEIKTRECYKIHPYASYDDWYHGLSKSTRQNIRTAYNRLNTDGKQYKYEERCQVTNGERRELFRVYNKRLSEITNMSLTSYDGFWGKMKERYHLDNNIYFGNLGSSVGRKYRILYISDRIAAFMISYDEIGGIVVPKLAIDTVFGKYSPGGILLAEFMKQHSNTYVDLSRGNEPYKEVYGGQLYYNYSIII